MAKIMERGMLLPIGRDDQNNIRFATPEFVMGLMNAFKMPGQVYRGERKPTQEDALEFALNMAGLGQATKFIGPLAKESGAVLAMNAPVRSTAAPLSEAAQVNKLIADNKNKFNTKDFYEFSRKKFRQKYMDEFDNDPSMQFMSLMHSSKRPDLTLDNFNFGSSKTKDFSDDLKHKGIAPDPVFAQWQGGIFAKQVEDADNFLTDPYYKNYLNRYIVTSGFKKPPLGPGGMNLERRAGAPMSQKMGLRRRNRDGTITVIPTTKVPMDEYFIPERAIKDTGGIDKVYSLENVTDYLRSLK